MPAGIDNLIAKYDTFAEFRLAVAMGLVPGVTDGRSSGVNPSVGSTAFESYWDQGGMHVPIPAPGGQLYASSSDPGDVGIPLFTLGQDENGQIAAYDVTLNGQSQVALVPRAPMASGLASWHDATTVQGLTAPAGDVYIALQDTLTGGVPNTPSKIQAKIDVGHNTTRQSMIKVPQGFTYGITDIRASTDSGKAVTNHFIIEIPGSAPAIPSEITVAGSIQLEFKTPIILPSGIRVDNQGKAQGTASAVNFSVEYLIFENRLFIPEE